MFYESLERYIFSGLLYLKPLPKGNGNEKGAFTNMVQLNEAHLLSLNLLFKELCLNAIAASA